LQNHGTRMSAIFLLKVSMIHHPHHHRTFPRARLAKPFKNNHYHVVVSWKPSFRWGSARGLDEFQDSPLITRGFLICLRLIGDVLFGNVNVHLFNHNDINIRFGLLAFVSYLFSTSLSAKDEHNPLQNWSCSKQENKKGNTWTCLIRSAKEPSLVSILVVYAMFSSNPLVVHY
jgi:hypothetical protein